MTEERRGFSDEPVSRDHGCFGCGDENPCGLHLNFVRTGQGAVEAEFTPRQQDEGFFGVVHGGIVTTMLDEAMAWAVFAADVWAVTARIDVRFRQPVTVGHGVRISGSIVSRRGRLIEAAADVRRATDGVLLAEATASFVRVPPSQADAWRNRYLGESDLER